MFLKLLKFFKAFILLLKISFFKFFNIKDSYNFNIFL